MNMAQVAEMYEDLLMNEAGINASVICKGESKIMIFAENAIEVIAFMLKFGCMVLGNENGWLIYDMQA